MNLEFTNKLDLVMAYWAKEGIQMSNGIDDSLIKKLEADLGFCFDDNFKYYLKKVNGFIDFDWDSAMFTFWSDTRIKEENENGRHPKQVVWFADHSLNLCAFGLHKMDRKIYTHFDHQEKIMFIADSFSDFLGIYLDEPFRLVL